MLIHCGKRNNRGARTVTGQIEYIRVFVAVIDNRGFAKAARQLGLSRTAVTRHVAELERMMGVQLLLRTTRSVTPTLAGQLYYERCVPILRDLDRADDLVRQQQHGLTGRLRVTAPLSFGQRFLPDVIAQFRLLHPAMNLDHALTDRLVDILTEDFDMALRISEPPQDKSTIWRKICFVERVLVASPGYLDRAGTPLQPADLTHHSCLGYSHFAGGDTLRLQRADGRSETMTVALPFECDNGEVLAALAARGEGIVLLPTFIVSDYLERGELVRLMEDWSAPQVWLTAYYPPYERLPAKVATFTEFVENAIRPEPSMVP